MQLSRKSGDSLQQIQDPIGDSDIDKPRCGSLRSAAPGRGTVAAGRRIMVPEGSRVT